MKTTSFKATLSYELLTNYHAAAVAAKLSEYGCAFFYQPTQEGEVAIGVLEQDDALLQSAIRNPNLTTETSDVTTAEVLYDETYADMDALMMSLDGDDPYELGFVAGMEGCRKSENWLPEFSHEWYEWNRGWSDGVDDLEEKAAEDIVG